MGDKVSVLSQCNVVCAGGGRLESKFVKEIVLRRLSMYPSSNPHIKTRIDRSDKLLCPPGPGGPAPTVNMSACMHAI